MFLDSHNLGEFIYSPPDRSFYEGDLAAFGPPHFWESWRWDIQDIQGFGYELRDMKETYAVLSKQAIALGRNDLLNEVLAGITRVNEMISDLGLLNEIINVFRNIWPGPAYGTWYFKNRTIGWDTPAQAAHYVFTCWPQLKDRWSNEYYIIRQLEKKFTPAEIISVPEPYVPVPTAQAQAPAPEYMSPEDTSSVALFTESALPTVSAPQEQIMLAGLPSWSIILLAGAGIFMFLGKGKIIKGKNR